MTRTIPLNRPSCPHCGAHALRKDGNNRYRCKECRKRTAIFKPAKEQPTIPTRNVNRRLALGWSLEEAKTVPIIKRGLSNPNCPQCGHRLYSHPKQRKNSGTVTRRWRCKPCRKIYPYSLSVGTVR